jgi:hypothetical protein
MCEQCRNRERNERARGKNCVMPPPPYIHVTYFISRPKFRQITRTSIFYFFFRFLLPLKVHFTRHFRHFSYYCKCINVTRDAHALIVRRTTGQMQFIIRFYSSKFSISLQNLSRVS